MTLLRKSWLETVLAYHKMEVAKHEYKGAKVKAKLLTGRNSQV